ncbi:MAG TPA: selenocysteine-specific translation elongation factor [Pyrinomonadaceae bacterium]|nr:selenocysteine-specific translation elongation factor [Pyrinomonadaceae bacterium]
MSRGKSIIVGTAGHIDHGKTALVRALTGVDADRLPEEKRRGITIDIGFADLDLGDVRIGFVDVPGHERFVKNMLAGAHGIDVVALVIAADESVMPQTREHFDICRLLGVRQGLVVITKKDLVDEDLLQLVRAEAQEFVAGSFLEGAPIITVSSRTGDGIDELKTALRVTGQQAPSRSSDFVTRLPIDRSFTMRGFGAVVTGTLIAGEISEGEELELLPAGSRVRVRGVQVHGAPVARAFAGQRTAINLGGVEAAEIERGMTLTLPARLRPAQIIDAQIQMLADAPRALRSRQRVRVHLGAAEVFGRVRVLEDGGEIKPGANGLAQLRFELPVVGVLGDRFIIRSYSPSRTIGGGMILDAFAIKHRSRDVTAVRARLETLLGGDRARQVSVFVENATLDGLCRAAIAARTGWRDEVIGEAATQALATGAIVDAEGIFVSQRILEELKRLVVEEVAAHHQREPLSRGFGKEILRERHFAHAPPEIFRAVLNQLEQAGALVSEKDIVRARAHTRELSDADAQMRARLEKAYQDAALAAPSMSEAFARAGIGAAAQPHGRKILQLLIDSGILVRVQGEMFFHRGALDDLTKKLREYAARNSDPSIDVPAFKELAGISRKYAIPLLEYLDRQRVTRREGNRRVIL